VPTPPRDPVAAYLERRDRLAAAAAKAKADALRAQLRAIAGPRPSPGVPAALGVVVEFNRAAGRWQRKASP